MGCDGGTIPKRHELVKGPKKVEKVDKDAELVAQWNYCTLSQEILRRPVVACELGRLYNKDAVIEFLLDKSAEKALGKAASHIRSIKNVTELRLSDNPAWEGDKGNTKGDKHDDLQRARFICPVVGLEMNGRHRFCFLRCCGCVFSERALKEIKAEVCHTCGAAFQEDDVIVLNGTKEDVELLKKRMEERRLRAKLEKKTKKPKTAECVSKAGVTDDSAGPSKVKAGKPEEADPDPREKKSAWVSRGTANGNASGKAGKPPGGALKRSIADSEESETYKSIFTSHSSAKRSKEESAHWMLRWFLLLPLCISCACAFMFSSLREKTKESPGKVPCGGHFRIRQSLPEHTQSWLWSKWLWLFFVIVIYVVLKFRGDGEKKKEQNPTGLRSCQSRSPPKKVQNVDPSKDFTFNTLTELEIELVKFVSKVRNLKVSMATGNNPRLQIPEIPMDPHNNVTIYEIWGEEESE